MAVAFLVIGLILIVSGIRDTQGTLANLLISDFTGQAPAGSNVTAPTQGANTFGAWALAVLIIGALGYIPGAAPISRALLALVLIVLFLANGGIWSQFQSAFANIQQAQPANDASTPAGVAASTTTTLQNPAGWVAPAQGDNTATMFNPFGIPSAQQLWQTYGSGH